MNESDKKRRGFAAMNRELVQAIGRKGGQIAHAAGVAHEFTVEEARAAGSKGGRAMHANRRARETAAEQAHDQKYNR